MSQIELNFVFADGIVHDATATETSASIRIEENYKWSVYPRLEGVVGGPPDYSVQVSIDDVRFANFSLETTNKTSTLPVDDDNLPYLFVRIVSTANGTTAGTVQYPISLKQ